MKRLCPKDHSQTQNDIDLQLFKELRNWVVKELRISKANYYIQVLSEAKGNGNIIKKQLNSFIKPKANVTPKYEIKVMEGIISDHVQVSNKFNFFIQSVKDLNMKYFNTAC